MKTAAPALLVLAIMACGSEERHSDPFTAVRDRTAERTDRASPRLVGHQRAGYRDERRARLLVAVGADRRDR